MGVLLKYFRDLNAETDVYAGLLVYRHVAKPLLTVGYVRVATMGMTLSGTFLSNYRCKNIVLPQRRLTI